MCVPCVCPAVLDLAACHGRRRTTPFRFALLHPLCGLFWRIRVPSTSRSGRYRRRTALATGHLDFLRELNDLVGIRSLQTEEEAKESDPLTKSIPRALDRKEKLLLDLCRDRLRHRGSFNDGVDRYGSNARLTENESANCRDPICLLCNISKHLMHTTADA